MKIINHDKHVGNNFDAMRESVLCSNINHPNVVMTYKASSLPSLAPPPWLLQIFILGLSHILMNACAGCAWVYIELASQLHTQLAITCAEWGPWSQKCHGTVQLTNLGICLSPSHALHGQGHPASAPAHAKRTCARGHEEIRE